MTGSPGPGDTSRDHVDAALRAFLDLSPEEKRQMVRRFNAAQELLAQPQRLTWTEEGDPQT